VREEILVAVSPGERRIAWRREGRFHRYRIERPALPDGVGDLLRGRIAAHVPAMAGAFVALPEEGFLPEGECEGRKLPPEGTVLALRVTRAAQGGKGWRVSARGLAPLPPGEVGLVRRGPDAALRFAASAPAAPILTDDAAEAARLRAALGRERVAIAPRAFDDAAEAEAEGLAQPEAPVPGGGRLLIHPLPALTAMDVDGGETTGSRHRDALLALNTAAMAEAARQIALRDLAGPILLDPAGLTQRQRQALEAPLRAALAEDPLTQCLGLGPLGLFELRRARIHTPLHEVLAGPLARGLAWLRQAAREAAAAPSRSLALHAPPSVVEALQSCPAALEEYAARAGRRLVLVPDATREEIADAS
jgi:Ribonuclease G/E